MITVKLLTNPTKEEIKQIVDMIYDEWIEIEEHWSVEVTTDFLIHCCNDNKLPCLAVAVDDNKIVGTALLCHTDLHNRPDIYPCLTNVYVLEEYRGNRLSEKMMNLLCEKAKEFGYKTVYLYTEFSNPNLYDKFGYTFIGLIDTVYLEPRQQYFYKKDL